MLSTIIRLNAGFISLCECVYVCVYIVLVCTVQYMCVQYVLYVSPVYAWLCTVIVHYTHTLVASLLRDILLQLYSYTQIKMKVKVLMSDLHIQMATHLRIRRSISFPCRSFSWETCAACHVRNQHTTIDSPNQTVLLQPTAKLLPFC